MPTEEQRRYFREWQRKWRADNPEKARQKSRDFYAKRKALGLKYNDNRKAFLRRKYGLTLEQYAAMWFAQEGRCVGCEQFQEGKKLAVDHDHDSGHVRGLLCTDCNRAVGLLKDDADRLRRLADYLKDPN